jgi:hypothetical protein
MNYAPLHICEDTSNGSEQHLQRCAPGARPRESCIPIVFLRITLFNEPDVLRMLLVQQKQSIVQYTQIPPFPLFPGQLSQAVCKNEKLCPTVN